MFDSTGVTQLAKLVAEQKLDYKGLRSLSHSHIKDFKIIFHCPE